jgi:hypothetical protein
MSEPVAPSRRAALRGLAGAASLVAGCREPGALNDMNPPNVRKPTQAWIDAQPIYPRGINEMRIALSGDGRFLTTYLNNSPNNEFMVINTDTLENLIVRYPSDRYRLTSIRFGLDGKTVVFSASPYAFRGVSDLLILNLGSGEATVLRGSPSQFFASGSLSSDHRRLLYFRSFGPHVNPRVTPEIATAGHVSLFEYRFGEPIDRRLTSFRWAGSEDGEGSRVWMQNGDESCIVSTELPLRPVPGFESFWEKTATIRGNEYSERMSFMAFELSIENQLTQAPKAALPISQLMSDQNITAIRSILDANSSGSMLASVSTLDPTLPGNETMAMYECRNGRVIRRFIGVSARYIGGAISGDGRIVVGAISGYLGDVPGNLGFGNFADSLANNRHMFDLYRDGEFVKRFERDQLKTTGVVVVKPATIIEVRT